MLMHRLFMAVCLMCVFSANAIVLGTDVTQDSYNSNFSYVVSVRASVDAEDHMCGGTVIADQWVLTAAHCLVQSGTTQESTDTNPENITNYDVAKPIELTITQGVSDLESTQISNLYRVTHVVIHPDYYPVASSTTTAYQNDIALLYVERMIGSGGTASLVDGDSYSNLLALGASWDPGNRQSNTKVLGWGDGDSTEPDPAIGESNSVLKETDVAFNPIDDCFERVESDRDAPRYIASDSDTTKLCTMATQVSNEQDNTYGNGPCVNDPGGPLLHNGTLVGIISASAVSNTVCSSPTIPSWYTNIYHYLDWISSYTSQSSPPEQSVTKPNFLLSSTGANELQENYPYMVSVRANVFANEHYCGGTALSDRWVLTAAHCLVKSETSQENSSDNPDNITQYDVAIPLELSVTHGVGDLSATTLNELYSVTHVVIHPDYYPEASASTTAYQNDIALLRVDRSMPAASFATLVDSATYPNLLALGNDWDPVNRQSNLTMLGWGSDNSKLRDIALAFDPIDDCFARMESGRESPMYIASSTDPTKLCTMSVDILSEADKIYASGACIGDPGGPLIYNNIQVGIISASPVSNTICSSVNIPAWHTNVNHYLSWITSYVDAPEPPTQTVIKPTFLTSTTTPDPGDTPDEEAEEGSTTPETSPNCSGSANIGVGSGTAQLGCDSGSSSGGSNGWLTLIGLGLMFCRRYRLSVC